MSAWNYLKGTFNSWNESPDYCLDNGPVAVYLTASETPYEFKIHGNNWYGTNNNTNITETTTITTGFAENTDNTNFKLTASVTGYYVFSVTWSNGNLASLIVRFPDTTVYFYNSLGWSNVYLHDGWWGTNDTDGASNKNALRGVAMTAGENNIFSAYIPRGSFYRITFTEDKQVNNGEKQYGTGYDHFYSTNVVWNAAEFNSSKPLYVPTTTVSATINSCSYYYGGEWHPFPTYTRTVTSGNFGTICLPFNGTVTGADIFTISSKVMDPNDNTKVKYINFTPVEGNTVEAGKAYIFKATSTTLTATLSGNYTDAIAANGMMGNITSATPIAVEAGNFIISNNKLYEVGTGVTCGQYKGYITPSTINVASARGANFMGFENEATGIDTIDNGQLTIDNNAPMYNLAGQRVNKSYKGVVIVNGKKMLNK